EDLAARGRERSLEAGDDRPGAVLDVYEWPPLRAAEDRDRALAHRLGGEEIDHEVEAGSRRESVERAEAQRRGTEVLARRLDEHTFRVRLGPRIHRHRRGLACLVEHPVAVAV